MAVTTTYRDIEVALLEDANQWKATINGRERTFPTLPKARESIDKSLANIAKKTVAPFERFDVWFRERYGNGFKKVTVTSYAEGRSHWDKSQYAWVNKNGERSKEPISQLFPINEINTDLVEQITKLEDQGKAIDEQIGELAKQLQSLAIPTEAATE